jgi:type I restriction enzyme S subunit
MAKLIEITGKAISGEWGQDDKDNSGIPVLRTTNFTNNGSINFDNVVTRKIKGRNVEKKILRAGDIIVEKSGGSDKQPVGRVVLFEGTEKRYLFNNFTGLLRVKDTKKWLSKYVFYSMFSNYKKGGTRKYENRTTGLHNLKLDDYISKFEVSEAEILKQKTICDCLDEISKIAKNKKRQIVDLDQLVQARFVEMFGSYPINPKVWDIVRIRDVVKEVKYGTSRPATQAGKYPYLRMNNITYNGELELSDIKYIDVPKTELSNCTVQYGDVLFNRTNSKELVGKTCVYNQNNMMVLAGFIIRIRVNERVLPQFLSTYLNTDFSKKMLAAMCKTAIGQANINAQELQNICIYVPPIKLQEEFVKFKKQIDKSKLREEKRQNILLGK